MAREIERLQKENREFLINFTKKFKGSSLEDLVLNSSEIVIPTSEPRAIEDGNTSTVLPKSKEDSSTSPNKQQEVNHILKNRKNVSLKQKRPQSQTYNKAFIASPSSSHQIANPDYSGRPATITLLNNNPVVSVIA